MLKSIVSGLILSTMIVTPKVPSIDISVMDNSVRTQIQTVMSLDIDYNTKLKELGFNKGEYKDIQLDNRNAILRFQSAHNLKVDGMIGKESRGAILKRMIESEYKYPDIVTNPPSNKYWVAINKTKRILTLYKGKEVIKKYPIAQGKGPGLTPEGKFTIVRKTVNPSWSYDGKSAKGGAPNNPLGKRWIGISHGGGGIYGVHGNNAPYSIGTDASLGCVRMINADVEELFEIIGTNIPIWIGTNEILKTWGVHQISYTKTAQ